MSRKRFEVELIAPALFFGAVTGLASSCASSVAGAAAEQVSSSAGDAAMVAAILPSDAPPKSTSSGKAGARIPSPLSSVPSPTLSPSSISSTQGASKPRPTSDASSEPNQASPLPLVEVQQENTGSHPGTGSRDTEERLASRRPGPRDAPVCPGISAFIITVFEDPRYSVATLSTDPRKQGTRRRIGQEYGTYQVIDIAFNRRHMSSAVWLARGDEVCQVRLREEHPRRERVQSAAVRKYQRKARIERRRERAREARRKKKLRSKKSRKK